MGTNRVILRWAKEWVSLGMDVRFECECGAEIDEFTRGTESSQIRVRCQDCDAVYAFTITQLRPAQN